MDTRKKLYEMEEEQLYERLVKPSAEDRKKMPVYNGVLKYFPDAFRDRDWETYVSP